MTGIDLTSPGPRLAGRKRGAWASEARELLRLALPLAATQLAQMVILATDSAMLGHYSKDALAAGALGNAVYFMAWLLGSGLPMAASPVIAHIKGAHATATKPRDQGYVRIAVRMALWSVLLTTPPLLLYILCTRDLLLAFGETPLLAADAARFTGALAFGLPFALGFMVLRSFSTALSRAVPPLIVMLLAIAFNMLGDYALIFGHFGLPRLGMVGAGIASAASNIFSFAAMLAICLIMPALRRYHILHRFGHPHWPTLAELFRLGLPMGMTNLFEMALFNGATLVMGTFGIASLAAHQIAITIPSITFMIPMGIGLAATVRVGLAAGGGDAVAARRAGFTAMAMALVFMSGTALLLLFFPRAIASIWLPDIPENAAVLGLAVRFLYIASAFQLADGLQVTAAMSLRGLKDARLPMWLAGASYWLAGAPMCVLLGYGLKMQGFGIWLGLAFGLFVAAFLLTTRFVLLSKRAIAVK
jgi:MATE family multidrug resistance protein